jgi:hypothetical protein
MVTGLALQSRRDQDELAKSSETPNGYAGGRQKRGGVLEFVRYFWQIPRARVLEACSTFAAADRIGGSSSR